MLKHADTVSQLQKVAYIMDVSNNRLNDPQIQEFILDLQDVTDEYEKNLELERQQQAKQPAAVSP